MTDNTCGAHRIRPAVIGGPTHTHLCTEPADHDGPHHCTDGATW